MEHISIASVSQDSLHVQGQIDEFFDRFRIGTLLNRCGVTKRHGYSVRSLTQAIFTLPFIGKNFFRGIRCCSEVGDISFIEALYRVLSLAVDKLSNIGSYCERTASVFLMRSSIPHCNVLACQRTIWF